MRSAIDKACDITQSTGIYQLNCSGKILDLSVPQVMGVINATPDSFYPASRVTTPQQALQKAWTMVEAGAAIIDVGGEATNPRSPAELDINLECERVLPIIELLAEKLPVPISIDTSQPQVMTAAVAAGASFINDVRALRVPGALAAAAAANVPICMMHMAYPFIEAELVKRLPALEINIHIVKQFFAERIQAALAAGIQRHNIVIDPGLGAGRFGKDTRANLHLLKRLSTLQSFNVPILIGISRKIGGQLLGQKVEDRLAASLAATAFAVLNGANIIRSHDAEATLAAVQVAHTYRLQEE